MRERFDSAAGPRHGAPARVGGPVGPSAPGALAFLRQLLAEALMLSFTGAVIGVALANSLVKLIVNWLPEFSFPHERLSASIFRCCSSASACAADGIVFGHFARSAIRTPDVARVMQANNAQDYCGSSRTPGRHSVLIAGQIALTASAAGRSGRCMQGLCA